MEILTIQKEVIGIAKKVADLQIKLSEMKKEMDSKNL